LVDEVQVDVVEAEPLQGAVERPQGVVFVARVPYPQLGGDGVLRRLAEGDVRDPGRQQVFAE
jgi:hypothetical protein